VHVGGGIDHQNDGANGEERDRRKVLGEIKGRRRIDDLVGERRERRQKQCVAILGGAGDVLRGDARARARLVLDDDFLTHERSRALGEKAADDVGRGPRREANDEVHRPRRISVLRHGNVWKGPQHGGACRHMQKFPARKFHWRSNKAVRLRPYSGAAYGAALAASQCARAGTLDCPT
jgi:hypothetical protein